MPAKMLAEDISVIKLPLKNHGAQNLKTGGDKLLRFIYVGIVSDSVR